MYDHLLFDADGTLFDFEAAEQWALEQLFAELGLACTSEAVAHYHVINNAIWKELEEGTITIEVLKTERFKRFFFQYGIDGDPEKAATRYLDYLSLSDHLFPEARRLLETLASSGWHLSLVTNGISRVQRGRLAASNTLQYFDAVFIGEEIGIQKPHPQFFFHALEQLKGKGLSCEYPLIIGDSLSSDIKGGLDAGISTCWYNPRYMPPDPTIIPTSEIHQLHELFKLLLK